MLSVGLPWSHFNGLSGRVKPNKRTAFDSSEAKHKSLEGGGQGTGQCGIAELPFKIDLKIGNSKRDGSLKEEAICLYRPFSPRFLRLLKWAFRRSAVASAVNHAPSSSMGA